MHVYAKSKNDIFEFEKEKKSFSICLFNFFSISLFFFFPTFKQKIMIINENVCKFLQKNKNNYIKFKKQFIY